MSRKHPGSKYYALLDRKRWALLRLRIFERDGWRCRDVRASAGKTLECDHVVPLAQECGDPYEMERTFRSLCSDDATLPKDAGRQRPKSRTRSAHAWRELVADIANSA